MAKLKMQRIELLALLSDGQEIIDFLQRRGTVEILQTEVPETMYRMDTSSTVSQIEKFLSLAREADEVLNSYAPRSKSLVDSFRERRGLELSEFLKRSDDADSSLGLCYKLLSHKKNIAQSRAEIVRMRTTAGSLELWKTLDIPLNTAATAKTSLLIGSFPEKYDEQSILEKLAELLPQTDAVEVQVLSSEKVQTCAAVLCLREDADSVENGLRSFGFQRPPVQTSKPVAEAISDCEAKIAELEEDIRKDEDAIRALAGERERLDFLMDYLTVRRDKYEALQMVSMSRSAFYISGCLPQRYAEKTVGQLEEKFTVAVTVSDFAEDEEPPVLLKNNAFAAPAESITDMYALPGRNDIDPNPFVAFFYYMFFGMMFSDAGYGLLMFLATFFVLLKCRPEGEKRKTVMMYMYCGLSTIFWGVMYGSFFGDIINVVRTDFLGLEKIRLYVWMDPQSELMSALLWCFLFGVIHLFVGVAIKGYTDWRSGDKLGSVCDMLSIYLTVGGALPIMAGMIIDVPQDLRSIGKYCALAGIVLLVLTAGRSSRGLMGKLGSGLYALYNTVSGYLSDILSYSRLLALGLVTGIIGSVVNMMGALPQNKILKAIVLIIVFALGHAINFGINVIGAYVHTNRLQFVEFFSRFYEGGGREFKPLKVNTKTFKIKEEL